MVIAYRPDGCLGGRYPDLRLAHSLKSLVGLKEEDTLILSAGESNIQEEQTLVQNRLRRIRPYIRTFGWASAALLAIIAAIWIYRGVQNLLA